MSQDPKQSKSTEEPKVVAPDHELPPGEEASTEPQDADEAGEETSADAEPEHAEEPQQKSPTYLDMLTQRLQEKDEQLREYIAAYKRAEDDFKRARERYERDIARTVELEKARLVSGLFEVLDNFERSIDASRSTGSYEALQQGVAMVHGQFLSKMQELGVTRFSPEGEEFDPATQDAMGVIPVTTDAQHNKVMAVLRPGYVMGDRVLRPAMVQVGRKS